MCCSVYALHRRCSPSCRFSGAVSSTWKATPPFLYFHTSRLYLDCFQAFLKRRVGAVGMRTHGDLHLGQILNAGKDFFIIDFEGEPALSLPERRRKRSALRDVAGMLRSLSYAVFAARAAQNERAPMTA